LAAPNTALTAATLHHLSGAYQRHRAGQSVLLRTDDVVEGMRAFNEKRRPEFQGR
jgi:enoyl-CoA hydratase